MKLYQILAQFYDELFPVRKKTLNFLTDTALPGKPVLDVGCGTGGYTLALCEKGFKITGIDPGREMIDKAEAKRAAGDVRFLCLGMEDINSVSGEEKFGTVICIGNTLVHCEDTGAVKKFFSDCYSVLVPGGRVIVQVVNFDQIKEKGLPDLPLIETERTVMKRAYSWNTSGGGVLFSVDLFLRETGRSVHGNQILLPLQSEEIRDFLLSSGFSSVRLFGSYAGDPFTPESPACITAAEKGR